MGEIGVNVLGICASTTTPGCVAVTDCQNSRIQEFSVDGSHPPRVLVQFKKSSNCLGIASCGDGTDDYIVSHHLAHQVTRISGVDGSVKWALGSDTSSGGGGKINSPHGVAVLPDGQVAVSQVDTNCLQVVDILTGNIIKALG